MAREPRTRTFEMQRLDVQAFAAAGAALDGTLAQAGFSRLADSLLPLPGDGGAPPVGWSAQGEERPITGGAPQTWLHLQANTHVVLQCQRCLQALHEPLQIDRWFRFAASEDEAARLDEESEDDVLVASRSFDLQELLEDELILALPLVPRHESCPEPLPMAAGEDTLADDEAPANPFAALAALKRPRGD
ncbi:MAG: YceD family protein [Rubrivivax sp.]